MGFFCSRARCAYSRLGLRTQAENVLRSRLLRRPVRKPSSGAELARGKRSPPGQLVWQRPCRSHVFSAFATRPCCKAVRRARVVVCPCRVGGSCLLLGNTHPASARRRRAVRCRPGRGSSRLSNFGFFLPGVVPWIPRRGSRPRVMFTPVLLPASTAADSVNRDRPRRH